MLGFAARFLKRRATSDRTFRMMKSRLILRSVLAAARLKAVARES
jgi:hypothetical protein